MLAASETADLLPPYQAMTKLIQFNDLQQIIKSFGDNKVKCLEMTSKVEKVGKKYTFTDTLTTNYNFQAPYLFFPLNYHGIEHAGLWDTIGSA